MQKVTNLREKLRRKLSVHDKNPDFDDHDDVDEETQQRLHKEITEAEERDYPTGKPGSFLSRLIAHGNKKTDDQINQEMATGTSAASSNR